MRTAHPSTAIDDTLNDYASYRDLTWMSQLARLLDGLAAAPPLDCIADLENDKLVLRQLLLLQRGAQPLRGLEHVLVREPKRSPVHANRELGAHVLVHTDRILRRAVHAAHEPDPGADDDEICRGSR